MADPYVYGGLDDEKVTRWMRIPDDRIVWSNEYRGGMRCVLMGETLEKNPWAHRRLCLCSPSEEQPPHEDYDGR